jgi:hypothetical protein
MLISEFYIETPELICSEQMTESEFNFINCKNVCFIISSVIFAAYQTDSFIKPKHIKLNYNTKVNMFF